MILRGQYWPRSFVFAVCALLFSSTTLAADDNAFNCVITTPSLKFDLTSLGGEHEVSRRRETPPTVMVDSVRFDLCNDLKPKDGVNERDQCPSSTRVCLTTINHKDKENDRVVSVVPIASSSTLAPSYDSLTSPTGVSLLLHGPKYMDDTEQFLAINLLCASDASDPTFVSYNGSALQLEWKTPVACGESTGPGDDNKDGGNKDGGDEPASESVGSGIGWFFLALVLAFFAYFGIGAYYNYSTYGATGKDLIPHRDFWQEVPYMLSDVFSHLCSSVRSRRTASRGGYISV